MSFAGSCSHIRDNRIRVMEHRFESIISYERQFQTHGNLWKRVTR